MTMEDNCIKFVEHIEEWDKRGIPYGWNDLVMLTKKYGTPIPNTKQWKKIFGETDEN